MTDVKVTGVDRLISKFSPARALKRVKDRHTFNSLSSGYKGASRSRDSLAGWVPPETDANRFITRGIKDLRARSNDLVRDNPIAAGAIGTTVKHIVGTGLRAVPSIDREFLGLSDDVADAWEEIAEFWFNAWADSQDSDIERTLNFYESQDLSMRAPLENGDHFVILTRSSRPNRLFDTALQHIEAHRVTNKNNLPDTDRLSGGIETDVNNAPKFLHVMRSHPGSINSRGQKWTPVRFFAPSSGRRVVCHLYRKLRAGQSRGVPFLAPVMEHLMQLGRYSDAEIDAAVKQAFWAMAIHTDTGEGLAGLEMDKWAEARKSFYADSPLKLSGGSSLVAGLFPDDKIDFLDPSRPNTAFEPFVDAILTQIAMGLELPREVMTEMFQSSFSAARGALLQASKLFMSRRQWLAVRLCQPSYETVISECVLKGRLSAPGFFTNPEIFTAYTGCEWIGDSMGQIDENKAVTAAVDRINAGLSSKKREIASLTGQDYRKVRRQREKEMREGDSDVMRSDDEPPSSEDLDNLDLESVKHAAKSY